MYSDSAESIGSMRGAERRLADVRLLHPAQHRHRVPVFRGRPVRGLGSLFFLLFNGVVVGAIAGYLTERGFSETFYSFVVTHARVRAHGHRAVGRRGAAPRSFIACTRAAIRGCRASSQAARESIVIVYGVRRHAASSPRRSKHSGRRRRWLPHVVKYSVAAACWIARALLSHVAGSPCGLTRWHCGCDRARRTKPRISAYACARRTPRAVYRLLSRSRGPGRRCWRCRSFEIAPWLPMTRCCGAPSPGSIAPCCSCWRAPRLDNRPRSATCGAQQRAGVVAAVHPHLDLAATVAVALVHAAGLPARRALPFFQLRRRVVQLRRRYSGAALMMTSAFCFGGIRPHARARLARVLVRAAPSRTSTSRSCSTDSRQPGASQLAGVDCLLSSR